MSSPKGPKDPSAYKVDHRPFATAITPLTAYLLGLLWADGYVGPHANGLTDKRTQVVFTTTVPDDSYFVSAFLASGQWQVYRTPPPKDHPTWRERVTLITRNPYLSSFLLEHDYHAKSSAGADRILSAIPSDLRRFFFLGLVDGDGCFYVGESGGKVNRRFSIASSYEQDWTFATQWLTQLGVDYRVSKERGKRGSSSDLTVGRIHSLERLGACLYQSVEQDGIGLPRKREAYNAVIASVRRRPTLRSAFATV